MDLLRVFNAYEADLEKTIADDRWSRLERYFKEDAVYETYGSMARRTKGRDAIFRRLRKQYEAFDRRCQWRRVTNVTGPEVDGNRVLRSWLVTFHLDGAADLLLEGSERITFEDGRIVLIEEEPSDTAERHLTAWMQLNPQAFGSSPVIPEAASV